jgi:hypothetical protein
MVLRRNDLRTFSMFLQGRVWKASHPIGCPVDTPGDLLPRICCRVRYQLGKNRYHEEVHRILRRGAQSTQSW